MAPTIGTPQLLISDDDRDFRETLRAVLESRGFGTLLAADGEEAVRIVQHERIHLVLIDFHMPRLSGLDAIKRIKQLRAALPCILISAAADEMLEGSTLADSVLQKPVTTRQVTEVVTSALSVSYNWDPRTN